MAPLRRTPEQWAEIDAHWKAKREAEERRDQEQKRRRRLDKLREDLGRRYSPDAVELERFEIYCTEQKRTVERLQQLDLAGLTRSGHGLLFYGDVGTGKDHLLAAMLYRAVDLGFSCRWRRGLDIYGNLRDRMDSGKLESELLQELAAPDVLAVSDPVPPAGELSSWRTEFLQRLIDRRYNQMMPTWITLNAANLEDADARLSAPVFYRLQESAELLPCFWQSYRERQRQQRERQAS